MEELEDMEFQNPLYNDILLIFKKNLKEGKIIDAEFLINHGSEQVGNEIIDLICQKYEVSENWGKKYHIHVPMEADNLDNSVYTNILRLKYNQIKKLLSIHLEELKSEKDPDKQTELQKVYLELKRAKTEYAKPLGIVIS
jgi:DNA primase